MILLPHVIGWQHLINKLLNRHHDKMEVAFIWVVHGVTAFRLGNLGSLRMHSIVAFAFDAATR